MVLKVLTVRWVLKVLVQKVLMVRWVLKVLVLVLERVCRLGALRAPASRGLIARS